MKFPLPQGWVWARCHDVIDVRDGTHDTPKKVDSGIPMVTSKNLKPFGIDFDDVTYISEEDYESIEKRSGVDDGDILFAMIGTIGNPVLVKKDRPFSIKNVALFKIDEMKVHAPFFKFMLDSPVITRQLDANSRGGNQKFVSLSSLRNMQIPLPPLPEQKRIAAILDKADSIRRKRQEAVRLTEELLRSVFLDMFGDPVTNPKGWETGSIDTVLRNPKTDLRCGPFGTQLKVHELVNEGIPLFGIESVRNGKFHYKTSKFLTTRKAAELGSFDAKPGDVLVTRMGTIGEACVVPEGVEEARISYHLFRIRPDPSKCLPEFLAATIFQSGTFLVQLKNMAHGAIMDGLSTSNLRDVILLIPPITEQIKYVDVVKKSEKLMESQKETVIASDTLFNSLLQRVFNGDLRPNAGAVSL